MNLTAKLKEYQKEGIEFLLNNGTSIPYHSILGDDMGLGKTAQSIVAAEKSGAKKVLVICPSAVKINWMREFFKWSNFTKVFIAGRVGKIAAKDCIIDRDAEVVIINYDLCIMPKIKKQLTEMTFDVGIMDECHYLMNKTSGRTKAILARGGIIWSCKYKWALSGTFMKNRNRDCFALLRALTPHVLGKYRDYRAYAEYFCGGHMGSFGYEDTASTHTQELGQLLSSVMLRRTRAEVLAELPPLVEQNIYLEKTPAIEAVLRREDEFSEDDLAAILNFQMRGETATYRKELAMAKLPQVVEYAKEILSNVDKVTIFAYHRDLIRGLEDKLSDYGVEVVMGGLSPEQKQEKVDNFVNDANSRVFIGQIQAAGTGVDGLQLICSDVIFAEMDWVPGTIDQARARCHRMGQQSSVHIHYLVVADSLEEKMMNVLRHKRYNIQSVMKQVEKVVTTKGEKEMTIEESLSRIASALEKIAELPAAKTAPSQEETLTVTAPAEPKKTKKSKKAAAAPVNNEVAEVTKEVVTQAVEQAQPTLLDEATAVNQVMETPVAPTKVEEPAAPAKTLDDVVKQCVAEAQKLAAKIGADVATVYINEVTAQVTGMEGARLSNCNLSQAECVLDAIISKLNENSMGEI